MKKRNACRRAGTMSGLTKRTWPMTPYQKFNLAKIERLNDPGRLESLPPQVMWDALGRPSPARVVEIGAGTGLFAAEFAKLAPGATVWTADLEDVMLEWMTANRPEVAQGRIVPVKAEETHVPLPDEWADLVYMVNVHHELAEPEASYLEAFRLLRSGGQVLVADWAPGDTPHGPSQAVRASAGTIIKMLADAGFHDIEQHDVLPWHNLITARA